VAEFECGAQAYRVSGSMICSLKTNKMLTTMTLIFASMNSKQKYTHFEGQPDDVLSATPGAGSPEAMSLAALIVLTPEEKLETNSVY
jgi:hypothetical protein